MAEDATNYLRALLGQGLVASWGDEAEAWLMSRLTKGSPGYEAELAKINKSYGEFAQRNPVSSAAAEFAGGILPMVASYLIPGGQAAAPATTANTASTLARLAANPYVRGSVVGLTTGALSGAGAAKPGERGKGALVGGTVGTVVGGAAPVVIRGGKAGYDWLRDRLLPTEETVTSRAAGKINRALEEAGKTPTDIQSTVRVDRKRGIPSTIANADPALVDLAETVAQRSGKSGRRVEKKLEPQITAARERAYAQTKKALDPKDYYAELDRITTEMRGKADPLYQRAYSFGEVDDPQIMEMLKLPQFRGAWETARSIAEADAAAAQVRALRAGQPFDPNQYKLRDIYSVKYDMKTGAPIGVDVTGTVPDVRTIDYMKRALDAQISAGYRSDNAAVSASANAMKDLRNALRDRTKEVVPEYAQALQIYKGDAELRDALETGYNKFNTLDSEEVVKLFNSMSDAEKEAFTTGAVRNIYGSMMKTARNTNAANNIVNSPETLAKLRPMFESDAKFNLFRAAMAREAQLFQQSSKILRGSQTAKRSQAKERFEEGEPVGAAVADAVTGGIGGSITNWAARLARSAKMTDDVADKVAQLLMSSSPSQVAAAVKVLESYAQKSAVSAKNLSKAETGAIMGTTITSQPAPPGPEQDLNYDLNKEKYEPPTDGPDIEQELMNEGKLIPGSALERTRTPAESGIDEKRVMDYPVR